MDEVVFSPGELLSCHAISVRLRRAGYKLSGCRCKELHVHGVVSTTADDGGLKIRRAVTKEEVKAWAVEWAMHREILRAES